MKWFRRRSASPQPPIPNRDSVIAAWSNAMASYVSSTRLSYVRHVRSLLPESGCSELTSEDLSALANHIQQEPRSASWKHQRCAAFRHFLRWAITEGCAPHLCEGDLQHFKLHIRSADKPIVPPTEEHLQRLFGRGTTVRDQLLVALALELGWSPRHLVVLNCGDIRGATIHGIAMSHPTQTLLYQFVGDDIHQPDRALFLGRQRGGQVQRLSPSQVRRILHANAQKVGLTLPISRAVRHLSRHQGIPRRERDAR